MKNKLINFAKIFSVLLIIMVGGYYLMKIKGGGDLAANFVSLNYQWGISDTLANSYDSKSGNYQFLDNQDKLIKQNFKLRINNVIYLNSIINKEDLFLLPDTLKNKNSTNLDSVLRYEFDFKYEKKQRHIVFYSNYDDDIQLKEKAITLQKVVQQTVEEAQERYVK